MSITVSQEFKDNIYPYERSIPDGTGILAEVTYTLAAPESKEGGSLSLPNGNSISRPHQIMDDIRRQIAPVLTFENKGVRLDGSFLIAPKTNEFADAQIGWWSENISDEDGYFTTPLVIDRTFELLQTFNTVGIVFDVASDNYCTEFDIEYYDGFHNMILKQEIRDNDTPTFASPQGGIDISRVRITLYRTHIPYRYARIIEIDFGLVLTYTNNELKSVLVANDANHSGKAVITPKLEVRVANGEMYDETSSEMVKEYDLFDVRTYAPYFLRRQRLEVRFGLMLPDDRIEWVDRGIFYLASWRVSDSNVQFTAMGNTYEIESKMFTQSSFNELSLGVLVRTLYPWANVPITAPPITGFFGNVNIRTALTFLAELSCCIVYEDINNVLQFADYTADNGDEIVDRLDYTNVYGAPTAEQSEFYNSILLAEYDKSIEWRQISRTQHTVGDIRIAFSNPVQFENGRTDLDYEITNGFALQNAIWYTMYMVGTIVRTTAPESVLDVEINIMGNSITLTRSDVIYHAPWYTGLEELRPYAVNLPFMIKEAPHFIQLRDWFLKRKFEVINKTLNVETRYRGNPAREIADKIDFQFTRGGQIQPVNIVSHELRYNGGVLSGNITAVGDNPLQRRR